MKVLICGSRDWADVATIRALFLTIPPGTEVIHGGARGADKLAGMVAEEQGLSVTVFKPDWSFGRGAGMKRNLEMLDSKPDRVIAFWDGHSRGTAHTIEQANKRNIPVTIVLKESPVSVVH